MKLIERTKEDSWMIVSSIFGLPTLYIIVDNINTPEWKTRAYPLVAFLVLSQIAIRVGINYYFWRKYNV